MYLLRIFALYHKTSFMKKILLLSATIVINVIASAQTKSTVYFDSNKNDLTTTSTKCLDSLVNFFKDKNDYQITINGYCVNTGLILLSDIRLLILLVIIPQRMGKPKIEELKL